MGAFDYTANGGGGGGGGGGNNACSLMHDCLVGSGSGGPADMS